MPMLPAGSSALVKTQLDPERFILLHIDVSSADRHGHIWRSSGEFDEKAAQRALAGMGLDAEAISRAFMVARAQFAAAAEVEH